MQLPSAVSEVYVCAQARADGRAPAMALCTPHDPSSSHWTPRSHPPAPVISRLAALAQRSFASLQVLGSCHRLQLILFPLDTTCAHL